MTKNFFKNDPNFRECIQILNELKINYWLCHGTLLGILRDKSLIPWDTDIDIGTWDIKNKNKIIQNFVKRGFTYRNKHFGNNYLISFEKGNHRIVDINFYEIDKTRKYCFQRHYAIKNIFCRAIYVLSVSNQYSGNYKKIIRSLSFTEKLFKKFKIFLEKNNLFYIDAGFKTDIKYFKHLKLINYYGTNVKVPIFYKQYFEDLYGVSWKIPDKKYYWEKNKNKTILS